MKIVVTRAPAGPYRVDSPWEYQNRFILSKLARFELIDSWIEEMPRSSKIPKEIRAAFSGNLYGNEEFFKKPIQEAAEREETLQVHPRMFQFVLKELGKMGIECKVELWDKVPCDKDAGMYSPKALALLASLFSILYHKRMSNGERGLFSAIQRMAENGEDMDEKTLEKAFTVIAKVERMEKEDGRNIPPISLYNKLRELLLLHLEKLNKSGSPFRKKTCVKKTQKEKNVQTNDITDRPAVKSAGIF